MSDTPPRLIDFISDTATRPTPAMFAAMAQAPLGDEQKREDPTTLAFEARIAALLGQERALLLPSATMANQIALALLAKAGDEVICHRNAHIFNYETGGAAMISRAQLLPVEGERGFFDGNTIESVIRVDDPHHPRSRVVVVENTSNAGGGGVWPDDHFDAVVESCRALRLSLHIDGARLMNAAIARGVPPSRWGQHATTVQMCFSKGLGCPFGAVLAMPDALFWHARRLKQTLGGALRQSGILAAAMDFALDAHAPKLADDHRRAQVLSTALARHDGIRVEPVETNLVFFHVERPELSAPDFCQALRARGIRMGATSPTRVRACLHLDISDPDIEYTCRAIDEILRGITS